MDDNDDYIKLCCYCNERTIIMNSNCCDICFRAYCDVCMKSGVPNRMTHMKTYLFYCMQCYIRLLYENNSNH